MSLNAPALGKRARRRRKRTDRRSEVRVTKATCRIARTRIPTPRAQTLTERGGVGGLPPPAGYRARIARLRDIDEIIATSAPDAFGPADFGLHFERAALLDAVAATDAAREAYLDVLRRDPCYAAALNGLGRLLDRTGYPVAARSAYAQAVAANPDDPVGHGNLATSLLDGGDFAAAREHYEHAVRLDPDHEAAHACLAILCLRQGDERAARTHGRIGFRSGATAWPFRGSSEPVPVLVVHSALGGNVDLEPYLDDRIFAKWTVVAEFFDPERPLPAHALAVNVVGDADRCGTALNAAAAILARTTAPVINPPERIRSTARAGNAARLAELPGVRAPRVCLMPRARLTPASAEAELAAAGLSLPVIVRAPGFHTGKHCRLVTAGNDVAAAIADMPGENVLAIEFVDVRAADRAFRKYRVMLVGGAILPLHLAISTDWKVHYFRSDMAGRPDHRAEEAAFLRDMNAVLGSRACAALHAIAARLELDYGGIDFGIDAEGRIVVFEANATMVVAAPAADACWDYRRAAVTRIDAAVRALLIARARALPGTL